MTKQTKVTANIGALRPVLQAAAKKCPRRRLLITIGDQSTTATVSRFINGAVRNLDVAWEFDPGVYRIKLVGVSKATAEAARIALESQANVVYALGFKTEPNRVISWTDPVEHTIYRFTADENGFVLFYVGETGDCDDRIRLHKVYARKYGRQGESSDKNFPLYRFMSQLDLDEVKLIPVDERGARTEAEWVQIMGGLGHTLLNAVAARKNKKKYQMPPETQQLALVAIA